MLTRLHHVLIGLLIVQVGLAALLLLRGRGDGPVQDRPLLAGLDAAKVTRLQVFANGATTQGVDLVRRGDAWVLASHFDYPATASKVTDVLTPIAKMAAGAPVATQASRHKQLRVADTDFERKVIVTADGKDTTVFLGGSAGLRRNAVRIDKDARVFAVAGVSPWSFATEPRDWVDPKYAGVPTDQIDKLVVQRDTTTVELEREQASAPATGSAGSATAGSATPPATPAWKVRIGGAPMTLAAGETLDTDAIDRVVGKVATIELQAPADPKRDVSKPTAIVTVHRKPDGATTPAPVVFDVIADGETGYWIRQRGIERAVKVDKPRLAELVDVDRAKLVKKAEPSPPPAPKPPG